MVTLGISQRIEVPIPSDQNFILLKKERAIHQLFKVY